VGAASTLGPSAAPQYTPVAVTGAGAPVSTSPTIPLWSMSELAIRTSAACSATPAATQRTIAQPSTVLPRQPTIDRPTPHRSITVERSSSRAPAADEPT
jgi:hypothetical protein